MFLIIHTKKLFNDVFFCVCMILRCLYGLLQKRKSSHLKWFHLSTLDRPISELTWESFRWICVRSISSLCRHLVMLLINFNICLCFWCFIFTISLSWKKFCVCIFSCLMSSVSKCVYEPESVEFGTWNWTDRRIVCLIVFFKGNPFRC